MKDAQNYFQMEEKQPVSEREERKNTFLTDVVLHCIILFLLISLDVSVIS
jgi:hypothetical protein